MKQIILIILLSIPILLNAQKKDTKKFKKRVLNTTELDVLSSFYTQKGDHAAVTGGIGDEKLDDFATNINVKIPLNEDDILTIDASISAYSSASSSNLNPFDGAKSSASTVTVSQKPEGSPWVESSGASASDAWVSANIGYNHSSDDRNTIYNANLSIASEYDYTSFGFGAGINKLFNEKNTEISLGINAYIDRWNPMYPTEISSFYNEEGNLNSGFFNGVDILDKVGKKINKFSTDTWKPLNKGLITDKGRNTFSLSYSFSQVLTPTIQFAIFGDVIYQSGWLSNPMQRVYFSDKDNFYIGNGESISNYQSRSNKNVFQLADDIERLPDNRLKLPIGVRLNYYISDAIKLRSYYRYYYDDWGINSNTINIEIPIKLNDSFTFYPSYRYYNQSKADYFAPYETHLSSSKYYTSDYDLSKFNSNQYGFGLKYTDFLTQKHLWSLGLKHVYFEYKYYDRNTGLSANVFSLGVKFIVDK